MFLIMLEESDLFSLHSQSNYSLPVKDTPILLRWFVFGEIVSEKQEWEWEWGWERKGGGIL